MNPVERVAEAIFPGARVLEQQRLEDGFRNASFKVRLSTRAEPLVVRIYQHGSSFCRKELDLMRLVADNVPVPEVIHAQPKGLADVPPFVVLRWVEGITFRELRQRAGGEAIAQAAASAGETLAAIHRHSFVKPGWLAPGLLVTEPLMPGENSKARFVDRCLASGPMQRRLPEDLRGRLHRLMWSAVRELADHERAATLVHGDFNQRNVLVHERDGRWQVAAILDWEFAVADTPLSDLGNFLRYERVGHPSREPHFSDGYMRAGGTLPADWRRLARLVDLVALAASLAEELLPADVEQETMDLVKATVDAGGR